MAVFALLLEAAVPLLASAAARLQGVPVAAICEVYGVRTVRAGEAAADPHAGHAGHPDPDGRAGPAGGEVPPGPDAPADSGSHASGDAGSSCALLALGALAAWHAPAAALPRGLAQGASVGRFTSQRLPGDATALWVARLKHGPPASA
jgi:hypothetical protein